MSKYNFELEITPDSMIEKIMNRIRPGSRVLEFGCAEGRMTRYMATELGCRVCTVELDPEACRVAATWAERYFCGDLEQASWQNFYEGEQFDYLLFADVLEHLRDPEAVLSKAKTLLKEDGEVLISIPNIAHHDVLANLINDRFSYTSIGLLDDTHVHFWGRNNLEDFAARCGFCLRVLDGVNAGVYSTEQAGEDRLPPVLEECLSHRPNNTVYQYFLVLTKSENPGTFEDRLSKPRPEWQAAFYWDMGEGYSQERLNYAMPVVLPDGAVLFSDIPVPAHCEKLRFDPTEGICCLVSNLRCTIDGMDHAPLSANGMPVPSGTLFLTEDPQYEFAVPNHASAVTIGAYIRRLSQAETEDLRILTEDSLKIRSLALENQKLFDQLQGECLLVEQLSNEIKLAKQYQKQAEAENQQLSQENSRLLGDFRNLEDGYRTLEKGYFGMEERVHALENGYWALENAYNRVLNSRSYRITAPLRMIVAAVKGTRVGRKLYQGLWCLKHLGLRVTVQKFFTFVKKHSPLPDLHAWRMSLDILLIKTKESLKTDGLKKTMVKMVHYFGKKDTVVGTNANLMKFPSILDFLNCCLQNGGNIYNSNLFKKIQGDVVLLVSHELDLTGAPIALEYFALELMRMGKYPIMIAPNDDVLRKRIFEEGIPVITLPELYQSDIVPRAAHLFDFIVVNTIVGGPLIAKLNGTQTQVLWWIHEANVSYHPGATAAMPDSLQENIHVYCVGSRAKRVLGKYRPNYYASQLLYCVPDMEETPPEKQAFSLKGITGKTVFAVVGVQEQRKGQDVLVDAIRELPDEIREKCHFVFVGRQHYPPIMEAINHLIEAFPENITFVPQLSRQQIVDMYSQIDCLICSSRDDPMPIVVTEAMALSRLIICSENSGSAGILQKNDAGIIYRNDSPSALADCIIQMVTMDDTRRGELRRNARSAYEKYFSPDSFACNIEKITKLMMATPGELLPCNETVSVVIPTFQAGPQFEQLLRTLGKQQNIKKVEIVVVDSGSRDETVKLAREAGAVVIEISQSEFSHSYARNLGGEHSSGAYILFMTQDAMPDGNLWLSKFLQPLLRGDAVAASCKETPRSDCDLLGGFGIWFHSAFMGIQTRDRILTMPETEDYISLRMNGQLNDVSCVMRADIHQNFKFRGDYAEDLDLGIRLIRAGYQTALLSSVQVIHSHTRPAVYHLKRCIVDNITMKRIIPDYPMRRFSEFEVANKILSEYITLVNCSNICCEKQVYNNYFALCTGVYQKILDANKKVRFFTKAEIQASVAMDMEPDNSLKTFIAELYEAYADSFQFDDALLYDQQYVLEQKLPEYMDAAKIALNENTQSAVFEMMIRHFAQLAGVTMASYGWYAQEDTGAINGLIQKYSSGV